MERREKMTTSTPHDAVFKTLRHPETARDFMEIHLLVAVTPALRPADAVLEPGSFIEKILFHYSDALCR